MLVFIPFVYCLAPVAFIFFLMMLVALGLQSSIGGMSREIKSLEEQVNALKAKRSDAETSRLWLVFLALLLVLPFLTLAELILLGMS